MRRTGFIGQIAALLALLVVWEVGVRAFGVASHVMPRASAVVADMLANPELIARGIVRTLTETVLGFAIGALVGFVFGSLFAASRVISSRGDLPPIAS